MKERKYEVIDVLNDYEHLGYFKTMKEAKDFIKEMKDFDKRNNNPFKTCFEILKVENIKKIIIKE